MRARIIRNVATLTAGIALVMMHSSPAWAGDSDWVSTDTGYRGGVESSRPIGVGSGGGGSSCRYEAVTADSGAIDGSHASRTVAGIEYRLFLEYCDGEQVGRTVWLAMPTPADVLVIARDRVERTLPEPSPLMVWPDPEYDWAYAQVPIDFRADPSEWAPFEDTVTASSPLETVSVTIRAEPEVLVLGSGDPQGEQNASCDGDSPVAVYNPKVPGACSYTYTNASSTASNGRAFRATVSITWSIRYWSTTHPAFSGTLPSVTRESVFPMEVAEVKILGVSNP